MSDKELDASPAKSAKSRSRSSTRSPSRAKSAGSANDQSDSPRRSRSRSKSKSRSRSKKHKRRSRSHSRRRHSRSRSRSRRRRYSRSRSHSYDRRRSSRNDDDYDNGGSRGYVRRRSRSPFSRRRRHFGDRENPQTSRCLGVFGLSLYTQERDLREVFEHYGPVDEVQVVYDHQSGRSRGFAFVYMRNHEDALEAKEMAAGAEIDGRKIRVDFSITARAHTPTPGVYLGRPGAGHKSRSPVHKGRDRRNSRSYSRSYSRSPRRY